MKAFPIKGKKKKQEIRTPQTERKNVAHITQSQMTELHPLVVVREEEVF